MSSSPSTTAISLRYHDQRKLRGVWLAATDADVDRILGEQGPDALSLGRAELDSLLEGRRGRVKSTLTDQSVVAGLGNLLGDEILWRARVHPKSRASDLGPDERRRLHTALRGVLRTSVRAGRVPPRPSWLTGHRDDPDPHCPRCGRPLRRGKIAGRTSTWCPDCQAGTPLTRPPCEAVCGGGRRNPRTRRPPGARTSPGEVSLHQGAAGRRSHLTKSGRTRAGQVPTVSMPAAYARDTRAARLGAFIFRSIDPTWYSTPWRLRYSLAAICTVEAPVATPSSICASSGDSRLRRWPVVSSWALLVIRLDQDDDRRQGVGRALDGRTGQLAREHPASRAVADHALREAGAPAVVQPQEVLPQDGGRAGVEQFEEIAPAQLGRGSAEVPEEVLVPGEDLEVKGEGGHAGRVASGHGAGPVPVMS